MLCVLRSDQEDFTAIKDPIRKREVRNSIANYVKPRGERALCLWAREAGLLHKNREFEWFKRNNLLYHSTYLEFFHRLAPQPHVSGGRTRGNSPRGDRAHEGAGVPPG